MNIVVAMKQVPDIQQIRIRARKPVMEDVVYTFGSFDKNALEAGVQLKEALGGKLIVLCVGNTELEDTVKEALAAGGDEALLVVDDIYSDLDSCQVSALLVEALGKIEDVGLVLFGEGSGDNYSGQVVGRVAELLNWPQIGFAQEISYEQSTNMIRVIRALEDVRETVIAPLPAVVSVVAEINEVRIPSVTQILKAGRKPKKVFESADIETVLPGKTHFIKSSLAPENNRKTIIVKSVDELLTALKSENLI